MYVQIKRLRYRCMPQTETRLGNEEVINQNLSWSERVRWEKWKIWNGSGLAKITSFKHPQHWLSTWTWGCCRTFIDYKDYKSDLEQRVSNYNQQLHWRERRLGMILKYTWGQWLVGCNFLTWQEMNGVDLFQLYWDRTAVQQSKTRTNEQCVFHLGKRLTILWWRVKYLNILWSKKTLCRG